MNIQDAPNTNPFPLFTDWLEQAKQTDPVFYCGMNIATVDIQGHPSCRVVLLKEYDNNGFIFYTNYKSRKGKELAATPNISANFWWPQFQRQIRIEGVVEKVSEERSVRYFSSRPQGSQLAAIASQQSEPIESLQLLDLKFKAVADEFKDKAITKPSHWGGYRIKPSSIEFWQGLEHRLHHRLLYTRANDQWQTQYLQP